MTWKKDSEEHALASKGIKTRWVKESEEEDFNTVSGDNFKVWSKRINNANQNLFHFLKEHDEEINELWDELNELPNPAEVGEEIDEYVKENSNRQFAIMISSGTHCSSESEFIRNHWNSPDSGEPSRYVTGIRDGIENWSEIKHGIMRIIDHGRRGVIKHNPGRKI